MAETNVPAQAPISVLIPAYNAARYLPQTLASVAAQTVQPAEVIVVDDGSKDDTAEIARRHGAAVVSKANGGAASARNAGLDHASQRWIILLDSDDLWDERMLERAMRALDAAADASYLLTDYSSFSDAEVRTPSVIHSGKQHALALRETPLGEDAYRFSAETIHRAELTEPFVLPSSFVVLRDLARELRFATDVIGDDVDFFLRLFARPGAGVFIDAPLVRYRFHPNSLSSGRLYSPLATLQLVERIAERPEMYGPLASGLARGRIVPESLGIGFALMKLGELSEASRAFALAARYGDRSKRGRALRGANAVLRVVPGTPAARAITSWLRDRRRSVRPSRG